MSLKERNIIAPQMKDYDAIGDSWVPYLMRFDKANRNFRSVSTDEFGFRKSTSVDGQEIDLHAGREKSKIANILLGSSAVFGVGATRNSYTIASQLNRISAQEWWNYGGRAFNSTQELILLQLFLPKQLKNLVICSGVNNLTLAGVSSHCSAIYNAFFYQTLFERSMAAPPNDLIGVRQAMAVLGQAFRRKLVGGGKQSSVDPIEDRYDAMFSCIERDLRCLKALATGCSSRVYFALQPFATWIDKELSAEERRLFGILDSLSRDWRVLAELLGVFRVRYAKDLSALCEELEIPFIDLNAIDTFKASEWLFVDRIHMTDRGYELVAEELHRSFKL